MCIRDSPPVARVVTIAIPFLADVLEQQCIVRFLSPQFASGAREHECQCHDLSRGTAEYGHVSQLIRRSLFFLGVITLVIMCVHQLFDAIHYAYLLETVSAYLIPSFSFLIIYRHRGNSCFLCGNNP